MQELSGKEYKLKEYQQDVDTKRELFEQFYTRFSETSATGDLKTANARLTDLASIPLKPIKPNKKLIVVLAFVASFMFAVMVAFLLKALDNTVKTSVEVENKLHETMLGLLPLLKKTKKNVNPSYRHYIEEPQSGYSESLRTIRTGVILSSLDNPYKILSVTSTIPGEGKTSTALGLAYSLAQLGSVLLIDADMRRPSIHKALGLHDQKMGLSNLVAQSNTMEECIVTYDEGNFDVLTCGVLPPNPSELLSSKRFKDLLTGLTKVYDKIIIDTAPCQAVSDALVLAPMVDAYLYVVKADSTTAQHAKNGLKRIRHVNGNIAGIILNQVDVKKAEQYYGDDHSGYYDSYGYSGANS
jgi:capsular exopolysaccharide synthesis family protein